MTCVSATSAHIPQICLGKRGTRRTPPMPIVRPRGSASWGPLPAEETQVIYPRHRNRYLLDPYDAHCGREFTSAELITFLMCFPE